VDLPPSRKPPHVRSHSATLGLPNAQHQPLTGGRASLPHAANDAAGTDAPEATTTRTGSCPVATARQPVRVLPAATGEPAFEVSGASDFPDGAHRCRSGRAHIKQSAEASDLDGATPSMHLRLGMVLRRRHPAALIIR